MLSFLNIKTNLRNVTNIPFTPCDKSPITQVKYYVACEHILRGCEAIRLYYLLRDLMCVKAIVYLMFSSSEFSMWVYA